MSELDRIVQRHRTVAVRYGSGAGQHLRGGLVGRYERMQDYKEMAKGKGPLARVAGQAYDQMNNEERRKQGLPPLHVRPL